MFRDDVNLVKIHMLDYVEDIFQTFLQALKENTLGDRLQQMTADVPEPMNRMFIERRKRVTEKISQQNCMFPMCINWCTVNVRISAKLQINGLSGISTPPPPPKDRKI